MVPTSVGPAWLLREGRRYAPTYLSALLLISAGGLIGLLDPLLLRWLIDTVLPQQDYQLLGIAVGGILLTYAGSLLLVAWGDALAYAATERVRMRMQTGVTRHLYGLSAEYHARTPVGQLMFRVQQDVSQVAGLFRTLLVGLIRSVLVTMVLLAIMLSLDWRLTLLVVPLVPAFACLRKIYDDRLRRSSMAAREQRERVSAFVQELLSTVLQVQLLNRAPARTRRFLRLSRDASSASIRLHRLEQWFGVCSMLMIVVAGSILLAYGGVSVMSGSLTAGTLVAFYSYVWRLFEPIGGLVGVDKTLQAAIGSIKRIDDIRSLRSEIVERPTAVALDGTRPHAISFENVTFGYGEGVNFIQNMTFHVQAGEHVALVGRSGGGKTTVAKLVARLQDPRDGVVAIGTHDLRDVTLRSVRSVVGLVTQDAVLFNGTFRENLAFGNPRASRAQLEEAIEISRLRDVIDRLPGGWDEPIGPRTTRLSGGERQRLALARALVRRPTMLVLDEATSGLDGDTEAALLDCLTTLRGTTTVLFASHRAAVARWADRILVLDAGHIVEAGSYEALIACDSTFRRTMGFPEVGTYVST